MTETGQKQPDKNRQRYARLDRFLLYLLAAELGYFIFLMVGGVVLTVLTFVADFFLSLDGYVTSILWPVLPYIIALPLNMLGGFASLVLYIRTDDRGYPGTGHLLNWIFLMTTGWLFILAIVFMLPPMAGMY